MKIVRIIAVLLLGAMMLSACKKDAKKNSTPTSEYYFIGTVNGSAVNWEASTTGDGWAAGSSAELPNDQGEIYGEITALLTHYPGGHPQLGIEFKTFDKKADNDDAAGYFNSFVTTGSWAFSNTTDYPIGDKSVIITYLDENGKQYNSIGSQTGSSANVISSTPTSGDAYNVDSGLKIKLTLNCTLYPVDGTGNPIKITNGQGIVFLDNMILNF